MPAQTPHESRFRETQDPESGFVNVNLNVEEKGSREEIHRTAHAWQMEWVLRNLRKTFMIICIGVSILFSVAGAVLAAAVIVIRAKEAGTKPSSQPTETETALLNSTARNTTTPAPVTVVQTATVALTVYVTVSDPTRTRSATVTSNPAVLTKLPWVDGSVNPELLSMMAFGSTAGKGEDGKGN